MKFIQKTLIILTCLLLPISVMSAEKLPDFSVYKDVKEKKKAFFNYMLPKVNQVNQEILKEREFISKNKLGNPPYSAKWQALIEKYRVNTKNKTAKQIKQALLKRADIIPPSLALAQAANESSWGTSRFAKQAYNFYGQWCFTEGCGLVPSQRTPGKTHEVRKFKNPTASVRSYMRNLNSHAAFKSLRDIRLSLRASQKPITGKSLSSGLLRYSERKEEYIKELNAMIRVNKLTKYDTL